MHFDIPLHHISLDTFRHNRACNKPLPPFPGRGQPPQPGRHPTLERQAGRGPQALLRGAESGPRRPSDDHQPGEAVSARQQEGPVIGHAPAGESQPESQPESQQHITLLDVLGVCSVLVMSAENYPKSTSHHIHITLHRNTVERGNEGEEWGEGEKRRRGKGKRKGEDEEEEYIGNCLMSIVCDGLAVFMLY